MDILPEINAGVSGPLRHIFIFSNVGNNCTKEYLIVNDLAFECEITVERVLVLLCLGGKYIVKLVKAKFIVGTDFVNHFTVNFVVA